MGYGCYKISLSGAELAWQLPDEADFMHYCLDKDGGTLVGLLFESPLPLSLLSRRL